MRWFGAAPLPGLEIVADALPSPWVMPVGLADVHRDRLAALAFRSVRHATAPTAIVEVSWPERVLIEHRRLRVLPTDLVRWRVGREVQLAPEDVIHELRAVHAGPAIYDFERVVVPPSIAWLPPFRDATLYRLIDLLADRQPVDDTEALIERLQALAGYLLSPIDVIDACDDMIYRRAEGDTMEEAWAFATAGVLTRRVKDTMRDAFLAMVDAPAEQRVQNHRRGMEAIGVLDLGSDGPHRIVSLLDDARVRAGARRAFGVYERELGRVASAFSDPVSFIARELSGIELEPTTDPASLHLTDDELRALRRHLNATSAVEVARRLAAIEREDHRAWSVDERRFVAEVYTQAAQSLKERAERDVAIRDEALAWIHAAFEIYEALGRGDEAYATRAMTAEALSLGSKPSERAAALRYLVEDKRFERLPQEVRAALLNQLALVNLHLGEPSVASTHALRVLAMNHLSTQHKAFAHRMLCGANLQSGDVAGALHEGEIALDLTRKLQDPMLRIDALRMLAMVSSQTGSHRTMELFREAIDTLSKVPEGVVRSGLAAELAQALALAQQPEEATRLLDSIEGLDVIGLAATISYTRALIAEGRGQAAAALEQWRATLEAATTAEQSLFADVAREAITRLEASLALTPASSSSPPRRRGRRR